MRRFDGSGIVDQPSALRGGQGYGVGYEGGEGGGSGDVGSCGPVEDRVQEGHEAAGVSDRLAVPEDGGGAGVGVGGHGWGGD